MANKIHLISTGQQSLQTLAETVKGIHNDFDALHLREKTWDAADLVHAVQALAQEGVPPEKMIINDRVDVAYMCQTKGVHLAYHSIPVGLVKKHYPSLQVGCSVHSLQEGLDAAQEGADYLTYGHVFHTSSKPDLAPRGVKELEALKKQVSTPVLAIGGITPNNTTEVMTAGADGIAVLSGVLLADDPKTALAAYRRALQSRR